MKQKVDVVNQQCQRLETIVRNLEVELSPDKQNVLSLFWLTKTFRAWMRDDDAGTRETNNGGTEHTDRCSTRLTNDGRKSGESGIFHWVCQRVCKKV